MLAEMTGANEKYTTKRYIDVQHIVHNSKVRRTRLARGIIFENIGIPKETMQNLPFIERYFTTGKFSYI